MVMWARLHHRILTKRGKKQDEECFVQSDPFFNVAVAGGRGWGGVGHNLCVFVVCWDENKIRVLSSSIIIASSYAMGYWCIVMRGGRWAFAVEFRCQVC